VEAVPLTDEETAEAIYAGKEKKFTELLKQEYWQKVTTQKVAYRYSPSELWHKLKKSRNALGEYFKIDAENEIQVRQLCLYFAQDTRFETEYGMKLHKGLWLAGPKGVGKTHLLSFFFQNQHQSYVMHSCRAIEDRWHNNEPNVIDFFTHPILASVNGDPFGHSTLGVCFDDLGTESIPSKRFGEEKNVMAEIILGRYENNIHFTMQHFATNLTPTDLEDLYGDRVRDRLKEMCNMIIFHKDTKSRRK
jgi:DNA replication protein DnaC